MDYESEQMSIWELRRDDVVLARLEEYDQDFPWVSCRFEEAEAFEPFRHYFVRDDGRWRGRTEELHREIAREGIFLITTDGHRPPAFTLSLVGDEARLTFTPV
jgi:hypothetical protein